MLQVRFAALAAMVLCGTDRPRQDRQGRHATRDHRQGIGTNRVPPDQWRTGYVIAAHAVATNAEGDVFVAEFTTFGRVHKFDRR